MAVVSSDHVSVQNWPPNPIQSSVSVTRHCGAAVWHCNWSIVIIFSGLVSVGIAFLWTWCIITDNMNVWHNRFDNPSPGSVYELLTIYRSISPTLDSLLAVYIDTLTCVIFLGNFKCTIFWIYKKRRSKAIVNKRPISLYINWEYLMTTHRYWQPYICALSRQLWSKSKVFYFVFKKGICKLNVCVFGIEY